MEKSHTGLDKHNCGFRVPLSPGGRISSLGPPWVRSRGVLLLIGLGALAPVLGGCGGGGSSSTTASASQAQIREAKKAGEEAAHEKDRVNSLEKQVRKLRHQVRHKQSAPILSAEGKASEPAVAQPNPEPSDSEVREFHVESGNVSCQVRSDGAICTVEPISQTFSFAGGGAAGTESGSVLPLDLGEVVPYGSTVAVGSVSCEIPPTNVPSGIVCSDADTGHGFEASRVASRQKVY
ncbi:MAG TPA: hypothetical protein VMH33_07460 [Solirubrobacterales bacterium]|nr:hypothetical protein [Solirubrobacterales bacterium]